MPILTLAAIVAICQALGLDANLYIQACELHGADPLGACNLLGWMGC